MLGSVCLYSSVVERKSCKLEVLSSILSEGTSSVVEDKVFMRNPSTHKRRVYVAATNLQQHSCSILLMLERTGSSTLRLLGHFSDIVLLAEELIQKGSQWSPR